MSTIFIDISVPIDYMKRHINSVAINSFASFRMLKVKISDINIARLHINSMHCCSLWYSITRCSLWYSISFQQFHSNSNQNIFLSASSTDLESIVNIDWFETGSPNHSFTHETFSIPKLLQEVIFHLPSSEPLTPHIVASRRPRVNDPGAGAHAASQTLR